MKFTYINLLDDKTFSILPLLGLQWTPYSASVVVGWLFWACELELEF